MIAPSLSVPRACGRMMPATLGIIPTRRSPARAGESRPIGRVFRSAHANDAKALAKHGEIGGGHSEVDVSTSAGKRASAYQLSRIARDRPDILDTGLVRPTKAAIGPPTWSRWPGHLSEAETGPPVGEWREEQKGVRDSFPGRMVARE